MLWQRAFLPAHAQLAQLASALCSGVSDLRSVQEAQPAQPSRSEANGASHSAPPDSVEPPSAEVPADANGSTEEIRTVTAGDTPYTSAVSFDDLPLSEELKKVGSRQNTAELLYSFGTYSVTLLFLCGAPYSGRAQIWSVQPGIAYVRLLPHAVIGRCMMQ